MSQIGEIVEELQQLRALAASPGWAKVVDIWNKQIEGRRDQYELKPCDELVDVLRNEFIKGEIAGIRAMMSVVPTLIDSHEAIVNEARREREEEDGESDDEDQGEFNI